MERCAGRLGIRNSHEIPQKPQREIPVEHECVLKDKGNVEYRQMFRTNEALPSVQNMKDFKEHITRSKTNMWSTS